MGLDLEAMIGGRLDEMNGHLSRLQEEQAFARTETAARLAGIKSFRFRMQGVVAAAAFSFGGDSGNGLLTSPDQGYIWNIRHLVIQGLATGATPDVANFINPSSNLIYWQLNGNSFGQTFGRGEVVLTAGETLLVQNVGTVAAAAGTVIIVHGRVENIPGELIGKLY